eukprot:12301682-Alexandrium_andersonii.AAC.1
MMRPCRAIAEKTISISCGHAHANEMLAVLANFPCACRRSTRDARSTLIPVNDPARAPLRRWSAHHNDIR